jgi:hypothetical protein
MEPSCSLQCEQKSATGPCSETVESNLHIHTSLWPTFKFSSSAKKMLKVRPVLTRRWSSLLSWVQHQPEKIYIRVVPGSNTGRITLYFLWFSNIFFTCTSGIPRQYFEIQATRTAHSLVLLIHCTQSYFKLKIAVFWVVAPTLVKFYQTTRCYNPEDSNLHTHRRENLKSYLLKIHLTLQLLQRC